MFSLESAMAAWRQQLRAAGLRPEPLEELELHVCEEFQRLVKAGVGEEEAFQRAAQALGPAPALSCEFQKVARVRQAAQWKMFRNVFFVVALAYPVLVGALALDSERGVFMDSTAWQRGWRFPCWPPASAGGAAGFPRCASAGCGIGSWCPWCSGWWRSPS